MQKSHFVYVDIGEPKFVRRVVSVSSATVPEAARMAVQTFPAFLGQIVRVPGRLVPHEFARPSVRRPAANHQSEIGQAWRAGALNTVLVVVVL